MFGSVLVLCKVLQANIKSNWNSYARRGQISADSKLIISENLENFGIRKGCYFYKQMELDAETDVIMKYIDKEHGINA